jgi:hypothetical protein
MSNRKPKRDSAPDCQGKDCHSAKMDDIQKVGAVWYYKCPKCGRMLSACYVSETSKAMHDYMVEGKKKKEEVKPAEAPK